MAPVETTRPKHRARVRESVVDDRLCLYAPVASSALSLNGSARTIWELCDGTRTIFEIAARLRVPGGTAESTILGDIAETVARLAEVGLIEITSDETAGETERPALKFVMGIEDKVYFHWQLPILFESLLGQLPEGWEIIVVVCNDHAPLSDELLHLLERYRVEFYTGRNHPAHVTMDFAGESDIYVPLNRIEALNIAADHVDDSDIVFLLDTDNFLYRELDLAIYPSENGLVKNWIIGEEKFFGHRHGPEGIDLQAMLESFGCKSLFKPGGVAVFVTGATLRANDKKYVKDCFRFTQLIYLAGMIRKPSDIWVSEMPCFALALTAADIPYELLETKAFYIDKSEAVAAGTLYHYYSNLRDSGVDGAFHASEWHKQTYYQLSLLEIDLSSLYTEAATDCERYFFELAMRAQRRLASAPALSATESSTIDHGTRSQDDERSYGELVAEIEMMRGIESAAEKTVRPRLRASAKAAAIRPILLRPLPDRKAWERPELARIAWLEPATARRTMRDEPIALPVIDFKAGDPLPFDPLDRSGILDAPKGLLRADDRLPIVRTKEKRNIRRVVDVPRESVSTGGITSSMERPRSLCPGSGERPWFDQLTTAFLLQLRDGFIGDNVIFDADRYFSFGKWWLGWQDDSWNLYADAREVRHIDVGISIAAWGGESGQNFIVDCMPKLASVIDWLEAADGAHVQIVSHADGAEVAQWFWRKLGLVSRVVQKPKNAEEGFVIHADLALFADFAPNLGRFGLYPRHCLRPIQRRLGVLDGAAQDTVLYLRRTSSRSVANESQLLTRIDELLSGTHYKLEIFEPSGDLDEHMAKFNRAKVILGPHGGSFANLVFAQPGTRVVEFNPIYRLFSQGRDPNCQYWGLSQAAGLDYWTVEPKNFALTAERMLVDFDEVMQIVRDAVVESDPTRS